MKRISLFLIALLLVSATAVAAEPIINSIRFEGNRRTPNETIEAVILSRSGIPLNRDVIRKDIKELYKLKQFGTIEIELETGEKGNVLVYRFVEHPLVTSVAFRGNRKLKDEILEEKITIKTYRPLNENDVAASLEKIREEYAQKRYYLAQVDYVVEEGDDGEATLVFEIRENQGAAVRKAFFSGNKVFLDEELRDVVRTKRKGPFSFLTSSGKYEEEQLKIDKLLLTLHYLNHGYLKVKVSPAKVTISKDKRYIFISFQIQEGKQYRIGKVDIEGDILTTKAELLDIIETDEGEIYSQQQLEEDIQQLADRYGDEGYAFANIVPQTIPDDETLTTDIHFQIDKGERITIERINISGNTITRDKVIRRELEVVENDRYSTRNLKESRRKLIQLGFFEEVNFATPRGSRDDTMELNITVKERPTGSFNIGAGFSSVESFIFNASIVKQNFFGYGISGSISTELSSRRQFFSLSVEDPYFLDTNWSAGFSVFRNAYLFNDFRRTSFGGGVNVGRRFLNHWSFNVGYNAEDVEISNFSLTVPQIFKENASGLTSAVSLSVARDTRDNRLIPTDGTYHVVSNEFSGDELGGDNDFYRLDGRSMFYQPFWKKRVVFKTFGRMGYIKSLNNSSIPLFERYFAGGPNSLRGFFPSSVGPRIRIPGSPSGGDSDFVYGGDKILLFVGELEVPLIKNAGISFVTFFDAGNAFAEEENYSITKLRADYGFGLRWNSPMGPLRFEWGIPINRRQGEDSVVFNFTIGNLF